MGGSRKLKLLLDTHIWLWALLEPERLSPEVRAALQSDESELWISPISAWEALLLAERGRIAVAGDPHLWIRKMLEMIPRREAPITNEIALKSRSLTFEHQDPADRFLVATASVLGLVLVTADKRLIESDEVAVMRG